MPRPRTIPRVRYYVTLDAPLSEWKDAKAFKAFLKRIWRKGNLVRCVTAQDKIVEVNKRGEEAAS